MFRRKRYLLCACEFGVRVEEHDKFQECVDCKRDLSNFFVRQTFRRVRKRGGVLSLKV
jgi:hypothetical protein